MGLEGMELVMDIEDAFDVTIPDEAYGQIQTVGDLYESLLEQIGDRPRLQQVCLSGATFRDIRRAIQDELQIDKRIRPRDTVDSVLPRDVRRAAWAVLAKKLDVRFPPLEISFKLQMLCVGLSLLLCTLTVGLAIDHSLGLGWIFDVGIGTLVLSMLALMFLSQPWATDPPRSIVTFGDLAQRVLAMNYARLSERYQSWSEKDLWQALRQIIIDDFALPPDSVTKEAQFGVDLGI